MGRTAWRRVRLRSGRYGVRRAGSRLASSSRIFGCRRATRRGKWYFPLNGAFPSRRASRGDGRSWYPAHVRKDMIQAYRDEHPTGTETQLLLRKASSTTASKSVELLAQRDRGADGAVRLVRASRTGSGRGQHPEVLQALGLVRLDSSHEIERRIAAICSSLFWLRGARRFGRGGSDTGCDGCGVRKAWSRCLAAMFGVVRSARAAGSRSRGALVRSGRSGFDCFALDGGRGGAARQRGRGAARANRRGHSGLAAP